ncbi:putative glycosyl hydrolase [Anseongella ginsenosidimutans]|uniref:Putative glycosyl hydrolase n=1 Tax=Anseongella ginsenosidimutans TaxID=496056 RepID=A0A4R3KSY1_9SPHI|nr:glycosyl hydrolase [Anseongella ginsenosidimutans]QEC53361.1 hypothetical protein FRZ59_14110 [Anseongella ginsenosidimutans]TCS88244.1 putative glycosyl hydrolase [Anseongella ginsenosidimutans]
MKVKILISNCVLAAALFFTFSSCSEDVVPEDLSVAAEDNLVPETKSASGYRFGVAGTALGSPAYYNVPYTEQMALLKRMGMNVYKFQIQTMSDGKTTVPWRFNPFVKAAKEAGITLLPMLYHKNLDFSVSNTESYMRGLKVGKNFARQYKDIFTYYELGNELNLKCLIPGSAGKTPRSYNIKRFKTIAAYLKGMNNGIKSQDPDAKTMINSTWLHYGYLKMLEDHGIDFDIIAYHWYSEMDEVAKRDFGIDDIIQKLAKEFDKPIWFTEIGQRYEPVADIEEKQYEFISQFVARCKNHPQVKTAIVFQLFDQPNKDHILESNYGILKWMSPYTQYAYKLTAKKLIESN